jgi:hypothetical protein
MTVRDKNELEGRGAKIISLSEAIILQAIEDLWSKEERDGCFNFFRGEEFSICAMMAGMNFQDQVRVLNMVWNIPIQNSETEVRTSDRLEEKIQVQAIRDSTLKVQHLQRGHNKK